MAPGACSLADHVALLESGQAFEAESVDLQTKRTASGGDFRVINPKGYVPALVLDDGEVITENIAVLDWIAEQHPALRPSGRLSRTRLLEMLAFISTEIHHAFKPFWHGGSLAEQQQARAKAADLLRFAARRMGGDYLFGDSLSAADCYLFVMLRWAEKFDVAVPMPLARMRVLMEGRASVRTALEREGLSAARDPKGAVRENREEHRFERSIHDGSIAAAYYKEEDGKVVFLHMETPTEFSDLGIATELARGALDLLRASGRKAILKCAFMEHFFATHPEYGDVVAG